MLSDMVARVSPPRVHTFHAVAFVENLVLKDLVTLYPNAKRSTHELSVERPDVWTAWFSERLGVPLEFERRNASTAERGDLREETRAALVAHFAPEYDVWRRLEATGQWSGARGTVLTDLPGPAQ